MIVEPKPFNEVNFYRPCFNAHERGPPEAEGRVPFVSGLARSKTCVELDFDVRHENLTTVNKPIKIAH